jgi:uncharacterized protein (DUF58 family)
MVLACAIGAALIVCAVGCAIAPVPLIHVDTSDTVVVGRPARMVVTATNPGRRRTRPAVVVHSFCRPLTEPARWLIAPLARGETVSTTLSRTATQRGYVDHSHLEIGFTGAFGLIGRRIRTRVAAPLTVCPEQLTALGLPDLVAGGRDIGWALNGEDIRGVREWRAGDVARNVHWRSTARTGALTVVEREQPQGGELLVLAVGTWSVPAYERALAHAASTADDTLARGFPVSLLAHLENAEKTTVWPLDAATASRQFARLPTSQPLHGRALAALGSILEPGMTVVLAAAPGSERWREEIAAVVVDSFAQLIVAGGEDR